MNNAAAITAIQRALAHYRRRQAHSPTNHSAREIAQMSMLAEYLHETHRPAAKNGTTVKTFTQGHDFKTVLTAA